MISLRIRSTSSVPTTATAPIVSGHGGGDERTEHEQEEQEGQRYGERFGMEEIALHHRVDFVERGTEPSDGEGDGVVLRRQCGGNGRFPAG